MESRQALIAGWDQDTFSKKSIASAGGGGLGGEVGEGLVRKGIGLLHMADFDRVEPSNLNRQKFVESSIGRNKAMELGRILSKQGFLGSTIISHPYCIQDVLEAIEKPDVVFVGIDNQLPTSRMEICRYCYENQIPCVFTAVSTTADNGYVMVQEPGKTCWACVLKPDKMPPPSPKPVDAKCVGDPACCDILKLVSAVSLYAIDSLLMKRPRFWNYRTFSLCRVELTMGGMIEQRPDCPVCGNGKCEV